MKHRVVGRRLDRTTEHRTAMMRNLVTSLFRHERITTTTPKAKELKRIADRFITLAKEGSPHARRQANRDVRDVEVLNKLFGQDGVVAADDSFVFEERTKELKNSCSAEVLPYLEKKVIPQLKDNVLLPRLERGNKILVSVSVVSALSNLTDA